MRIDDDRLDRLIASTPADPCGIEKTLADALADLLESRAAETDARTAAKLQKARADGLAARVRGLERALRLLWIDRQPGGRWSKIIARAVPNADAATVDELERTVIAALKGSGE